MFTLSYRERFVGTNVFYILYPGCPGTSVERHTLLARSIPDVVEVDDDGNIIPFHKYTWNGERPINPKKPGIESLSPMSPYASVQTALAYACSKHANYKAKRENPVIHDNRKGRARLTPSMVDGDCHLAYLASDTCYYGKENNIPYTLFTRIEPELAAREATLVDSWGSYASRQFIDGRGVSSHYAMCGGRLLESLTGYVQSGGPSTSGPLTVMKYTKHDPYEEDFVDVDGFSLTQITYDGEFGTMVTGDVVVGGFTIETVAGTLLRVDPIRKKAVWYRKNTRRVFVYTSATGEYCLDHTTSSEEEITVSMYKPFLADTVPLLRSSFQKAKSVIKAEDAYVRRRVFADVIPVPDETLVREAITDQLKVFSSNHLENAAQIYALRKLLPRPLDALASLFYASPNVAASYLTMRYVIKPTLSDILEMIRFSERLEAVERQHRQTRECRAQETNSYTVLGRPVVCIQHAKVRVQRNLPMPYVDKEDRNKMLGRLSALNISSLGFHPGLETLWDLIPFSFVLDWGLDLSRRLAGISWSVYKNMYALLYSLCSKKFICNSDLADLDCPGLSGTLQVIHYRREFSLTWPKFEFFGAPRPAANFAAAGASLAVLLLN